jgi:hypothetical protein
MFEEGRMLPGLSALSKHLVATCDWFGNLPKLGPTSKVNAGEFDLGFSPWQGRMVMYRTGIANHTELAMLTRVMDSLAAEMQIEKTSDRYAELATHLLILFEASKDENRLLTLMRRSAGMLRNQPGGRRGKPARSHATSPL